MNRMAGIFWERADERWPLGCTVSVFVRLYRCLELIVPEVQAARVWVYDARHVVARTDIRPI